LYRIVAAREIRGYLAGCAKAAIERAVSVIAGQREVAPHIAVRGKTGCYNLAIRSNSNRRHLIGITEEVCRGLPSSAEGRIKSSVGVVSRKREVKAFAWS